MLKEISLAILDDHPLMMEGYVSKLKTNPEIKVVATAGVADAIEPILSKYHIDILILDVSVPISETDRNPYPILHAIPKWLNEYPHLKILIISMRGDRGLIKSIMNSGASGYILKDDADGNKNFCSIIIRVANGGVYLSPEAYRIFQLATEGANSTEKTLSPKQKEILSIIVFNPNISTQAIAKKMHIATSAARELLVGIYILLGVNDRRSAVEKAQVEGFISLFSGYSLSTSQFQNRLKFLNSKLIKPKQLWIVLFILVIVFIILLNILQ